MNNIVILNVSIRPQEMNDTYVEYCIDDHHQIYLMRKHAKKHQEYNGQVK